jgi:beta-N-acetylhexosaminidase
MATSRPKAIIFGVAAHTLTDPEKQFFRYANPFGFILFQRNCGSPAQVKQLVKELRTAVGREDAPVLIDQEGGRVARLKAPHWPEFPPARMFGQLVETHGADLGLEAAKINAQLIAIELMELGINVNCAPLADILFKETDRAIGDRAYSDNPAVVADCARACAEGFLWGGVMPVVKHLPGHGRTVVDPHHVVSQVRVSREELEKTDFVPFRALRDLPLGMTNHIVYTALDSTHACSLSPTMHEIIRKEIGFDGLLMSDDLAMKGVMGRLEDLVKLVIAAGSDLAMHCSGNMSEMVPASSEVPPISDAALERWEKAKARCLVPPMFVDKSELYDRLDMLLGVAEITSA